MQDMQDNTPSAHATPPDTSSRSPSNPVGNTGIATPPANREFRVHPLWLALVVAALFGLVFGIGALTAGTASATSLAPSGTTIEQTTINVIHTVDPSVVQVLARRNLALGSGTGSGVILTKSGYIVTNDHVVHGFSLFAVVLATGQQVSAQVVGEAPTEDLAVLKINPSGLNLRPMAIGDSNRVQVGEYDIALGSPIGLVQSATSGIVSALNRQVNETIGGVIVTIPGLIQTSAPINPGNSGGALVNLRGELIGIPTFGAVEPASGVAANGIGFAVTSNRMKTIVNQLTGGII